MLNGNGGAAYRDGLTAQVGWLGLMVGRQLTLFYIHQMNWVNSHNDFVMVTLSSVLVLVLLILQIVAYNISV